MVERPADRAHPATLAVRVRVRPEDEDLAAGLLWDAGTLGFEQRRDDSGCLLLAYFPAEPDLPARLGVALAAARPLALEPCPVPQVDWVAQVRASFRPFEVAGFQVRATLEAEQAAPCAEAGTLLVEPGRAFGTGAHETTRLCLESLAVRARRRPLGLVADIGCGSAVLAIAALKLGARCALALDHDPEALSAAVRHARLNAVAPHFVQGDVAAALRAGAFELVLANLMTPLLLARCAELGALLAPGGELVLAGLLASDLPEVAAAYAHWGRAETRLAGEWAALHIVGAGGA